MKIQPPVIIMYRTPVCPYCQTAHRLLVERKGLTVQEIDVSTSPALRDEMVAKSGRRTVPQIFIDGQHIGGCDDLEALERSGELDALLGLK